LGLVKINNVYLSKQKLKHMSKKFTYLLLEVNSDFTKCIVKNQITGDVIHIDRKNADGELLRVINKVDEYDLIAGDEFN
jgi:hypothetical protein